MQHTYHVSFFVVVILPRVWNDFPAERRDQLNGEFIQQWIYISGIYNQEEGMGGVRFYKLHLTDLLFKF